MAMGGRGVEDVAADLDEQRFVGRDAVLARVALALSGSAPERVVYVHGSAGVGKSGTLRAMGRRAQALGVDVLRVDGRAVAPGPDGLAASLTGGGTGSGRADPRLILLDEVDELMPLRFELRHLIGRLPERTVVVLAGRQMPGREWFDGGLEHVIAAVQLQPLDTSDAREVLRRYGIEDHVEVEPILVWASGYPLALAVAGSSRATPVVSHTASDPTARADGTRHLDDVILARLAGRELDDLDPDVLDVAGITAVVDARLLAAVLPSRPTRAGLKQLRELSVSEAIGNRVALHRLVRSAVRIRLKETDPERYRTLVVRVADHLRTKALTDDPRALLELVDLIEDDRSRSGFGASATHYGDHARPGDAEEVGAQLGVLETAWWGRVTRFCNEAPELVMVVREAAGPTAAIAITYSLDRLPAWAADDIEIAPAVAHLRTLGAAENATYIHDAHVLHDPGDEAGYAEVHRVGNAWISSRSSLPNPRWVVATAPFVRTGDGTEAWGYEEVESLRRHDDERQLVTTIADFGPGGAVGGIHAMVCAEQLGTDDDPAASARGVALINALRAFRDDDVLGASSLGTGEGAARVASVRDEVRRAIDDAFTDSEADQAMRSALVRTYLDPEGGHAVARDEAFMSRATFYRHLQRARDRLASSGA